MGCWNQAYGNQHPYSGSPTKSITILFYEDGNRPLRNGEWQFNMSNGSGRWDAYIPVQQSNPGPIVWHDGDWFNDRVITEPGNSSKIITVGSINSKNTWTPYQGWPPQGFPIPGYTPGQVSYFSSPGPTRDGRPKPDVFAPGAWIASAMSSLVNPAGWTKETDNKHYNSWGTSASAPHVTGAIALLLEYNDNYTFNQIKGFIDLLPQTGGYRYLDIDNLLTIAGIPPLPTFNQIFMDDWNMIGLPLDPPDHSVSTLYPNHIPGTLKTWDGTGYVFETSLDFGVGYWLRFQAAETVTIPGTPIYSKVYDLALDWNMISGVSGNVQLSDVIDPGGIIITGTLFEFDGSYVSSNVIEQGKGYWIRTNNAGQITITSSLESSKPPTGGFTKSNLDSSLNNCPVLTIQDASGANQRLYFNVELKNPQSKIRYGLPPLPPEGAFDVRFTDNYFINENGEGTISVQSSKYPLTICAANLSSGTIYTYAIEEILPQGKVKSHILKNGGIITIKNKKVKMLRLIRTNAIGNDLIPTEFAAGKNYPNPFNPVTEIKYALPVNVKVDIVIYDILGQKVKTLLSGNKSAGYHSIIWDSTNDYGNKVASGIYIYRLKAGAFQTTKKMMLLK